MAEQEVAVDRGGTITESKKPKAVSNIFENALQSWTQIDLPSLQRKLDDQGLELKDEQKTSLLSRKNLAAKTKEFKKIPDDRKIEEIKPLLKLYQNEIDTLTNKKKSVEGYFFAIYRLLAEAPDPRPLIELSLDTVGESVEFESTQKEIVRLNEELSKKADYDQLKQRLLRTEQKSAELLSTKLLAKEDEFKAILDEKESNWAQQEKALQSQIREAQKKIEELRTSKEVTELRLNNQQQNSDLNSSSSILAELDIVSRDAESSKKRIFELERRNEELRRELSISKNNAQLETIKEDFSKKVSELEGENALLSANLDQITMKLGTISNANRSEVELFQREIGLLQAETKSLRNKLDQVHDYDEIKHELQLLRQIEFGQDEDEEEGKDQEINSILVQRNKTLTKDLANYRSQHDDLISKVDNLESKLNNSIADLAKAIELNKKLENDLAHFQDVANSMKYSDNASLISGMSRLTKPSTRSIISSPLAASNEDSSILPIITKQRDRFRDRNQELEDELRKQHNTINDLKRQTNKLKKDNEELYERTRYLASFNNQASTSQSINSRSNKKNLIPKPNIDIESNSYQMTYEEKLHPIEQFRIREQERINSRLSPLERLFISLTRVILATRTTRALFVAYCLGLHGIVMFVTIYAMGLNTNLLPEVGLNVSTGGVAKGLVEAPEIN